tara:strand:- start:45 stop:2222 length:2178 start_codon:yes stop_codon:yes gene_type:complete
MENNNFRGIPTSLFLNGPKLGIVTDPQSVSDIIGVATFTGITTASFPNPTDGVNDGSITFNWYFDGNLVSNSDSNITIVGFNTVTGTGSTLTISGISTENDNGKEVYFTSDYTPSAYSQPAGSAVTAGTARSTGNAFNEPLTSAVASISFKPQISISTQPVAKTAAIDDDVTFTISASILPSIFSLLYQWQIDGQDLPSSGDFTSGSDTFTVSGGQSETLTISCDNITSASITCKLRPDTRSTPEVISDAVTLSVVDSRNIIKIEQYDYANETATLSEKNLSDGSLSLSYDTHPGNAICLYAGERDIDVEVDMYGGKGSDNGSKSGGQGGYSKIRFTMKKDEEYVLTGLFSAVNAPFLYRKATLIAVVGEGGDAGTIARGGFAGGINMQGESGSGRRGSGGEKIDTGTLPSNGIFGSLTTLTAVTPDTNATGRDGGRTLPCTKGDYWRDQGKSPCEDLGTIKFRTPDGTEISNTAEIARGYKSGYNIIQTKGAQDSEGGSGQGGSGATGGEGGFTNGGGGGGSGYTDGSVTVVETTEGGSTGAARINIKLASGDFFIDNEGRILILSVEGVSVTNLTQKTGRVLPTDKGHVIDDARWQNFLDLARDGTQNYRLTATLRSDTGLDNSQLVLASEFNIHKMMNANRVPLRTSLADWGGTNPYHLAWDEDTGQTASGSDYSLLWYVNSSGFGYYEHSANPFFKSVPGTIAGVDSAQWWILPPGVPDFS